MSLRKQKSPHLKQMGTLPSFKWNHLWQVSWVRFITICPFPWGGFDNCSNITVVGPYRIL